MKEALEKLNNEMSKPHSDALDDIHNWICDQTEDYEFMDAILIEGKSLESAMSYVVEHVKKSSKGSAAIMKNEDVYKLVRDYYLSQSSVIVNDPTVKILANGEKVREVTNEIIKEIKVNIDRKSKESIDVILNLDVNDDEKLRLIRSLSKREVMEEKTDDENLSLFDF